MSMHAVVSGWLLGPPSGANQRLLGVLAEAGKQLADGERITVLHRPEFSPPALHRIAWRAINIPTGPTWKRALLEQCRLKKVLSELAATVYDHGFLPPPRVAVPTCLTIHDLRAADGHTRWPTAVARSVLRYACRHVQAIVAPSQYTAARLQELVPTTHAVTSVARNAASYSDQVTKALPRPEPEHGFVLHVGHLETRKNLGVVIRALAILPKEHCPELWLAGRDAGVGNKLTQLAQQLGVAPRVHQLGTVDDDLLHSLYSSCRAVVMPSIYEGFGMPALEGLAFGKPVLAAARTALPEVLAGHGTLLPPDQPQAWADAIRATAKCHPGQLHCNDAGRAHGRLTWTWSMAAATYVSIWRQLSKPNTGHGTEAITASQP